MGVHLMNRREKRQWIDDNRLGDWCAASRDFIAIGDMALAVNRPHITSTIWYDDTLNDPSCGEGGLKGAFLAYNRFMAGIREPDWDRAADPALLWQPDSHEGILLTGDDEGRRFDEKRLIGLYGYERHPLTPEQVEELKAAYRDVWAAFDKRLNTYWKRYSRKVMTMGFWADR